MKARIAALIEWGKRTRPARVWFRFADARGPILAQGLAYQAIFAAFAALWVAFSILGLWIRADSPLQTAIVETIANAVPGLIDLGDGDGGAISLDRLLSSQILGWTGAIAAIGFIWTAIGWFGSARSGVQAMLASPGAPANAILLKLRDLGLAAAFGIAVIVSSAISLFSTSLIYALFDWLGIEDASTAGLVISRTVGLLIAFGFNAVVLWALYLTLAATRPPTRALWEGALLGALGIGVLQALGGLLLGGASANPLLAGFAVIIGLLIWFNLACMVLLLAAAWIGEPAKPKAPDPPAEPQNM